MAARRLTYNEATAARYARTRSLTADAARLWSDQLRSIADPAATRQILDAGCGVGRFLPVLLDTYSSAHVHGVDPSDAMRSVAGRYAGPRCTLRSGRLPTLSFADGQFDLVFLSMVLHHCPDPPAALRECRRVLMPNGTIVVRTGTKETVASFEFLRFFPETLALETANMPHEADVASWLAEAGFPRVHTRRVNQRMCSTYDDYAQRVLAGGFPSFAFLSPEQLNRGKHAFAQRCSARAAAGHRPRLETVVLLWATNDPATPSAPGAF